MMAEIISSFEHRFRIDYNSCCVDFYMDITALPLFDSA